MAEIFGKSVVAAAVPVANQAQNALQNGQRNHNVYPFADEAKCRVAEIGAGVGTEDPVAAATAAVVAPVAAVIAAAVVAPITPITTGVAAVAEDRVGKHKR